MRKFLVISMLAFMLATDGYSCGGGIWSYNYYLFSVFNRERLSDQLFTGRINEFWRNYTGGAVDQWQWNQEQILDIVKQKNDREMMSYLGYLNVYLSISDELGETWSYPTKKELQQRKQNLIAMKRAADDYQGTRLKAQWMLLHMRADMVMGNNQENIDYWMQKASLLPNSVYRDMMENIYAGALMKQGKRVEACRIFATQGDLLSMKWAMRKFRNTAGIQAIYQEDANMPTLNYLVQDFVNNAQETIDSNGDNFEDESSLIDWLQTIDARAIQYPEVARFTTFANQVLSEGKTQNPALWKAAIGELEFLYGQHDKAVETLSQAMAMNGTERMKDNARAIRIVASAGSKMFKEKNYQKWLFGEMKWLAEKTKEDGGEYYNHYREVMARLIYLELVPRFRQAGQPEMSAALLALYNDDKYMWGISANGEGGESDSDDWNPNYSNDFFSELSKMNGDQILKFMEWVKKKPKGELEKWARQSISSDEQYYYDLAGTKFMAEGKFEKAAAALAKVSPSFQEAQNISYFLAKRDYTKPRWLGRQKTPKGVADEGTHLATLSDNPKLRFCKEMLDLESQYRMADKGLKEELAYQLAVRYYQASIWGDCWCLTHYGWSSNDTVEEGELDYVARAIDYLKISRQSADLELRKKSLYALAFIPQDHWCETDYNWQLNETTYTPLRTARQYLALSDFSKFMYEHPDLEEAYISKCDVLKCFRKNR